jgi:hypothetical protein
MMKRQQISQWPDSCPPPVIDTVLRLDSDGCPVYMSTQEALLENVDSCVGWILDHPADLFHVLILAALGVGGLFLVYDSIAPARAPSLRRRG